ncbi:MAG: hypothetical protein IKJ70_05705 [Clostridia bacterium]|nr:hypothetical protein [Clostridia bacterium]
MAAIFLKTVNMSISACWIVLAIMLLRIALKKAPKWINCILWGIAGLRLVMPLSFESIFSLIPSAETISKTPYSPRPYFESGVPPIDNQVNAYLNGNYFEGVTRPTGNFVDITTVLAIIWVIGIITLLIYTFVSFLRLKNEISTAILLRDNIYQSESVVSPFVLGIIKPKIYLPFNMNGQDMDHVVAHEKAHIKRKDHLWKPLGFLILTLHWFNPLMWLGYVLLCRDIELACDEKVIKEFNNEQRADYSEALLTCSVNRRMIAACPLAFGESDVKNRVKSVLNYKQPSFWVIVVAVIICVALAVGFLTNPVNSSVFDSKYETGKCLYSYVVSEDKETRLNELVFNITEDGVVYKTFDIRTTEVVGNLEDSDYTAEDLKNTLAEQGETLDLGKIEKAYRIPNLSRDYVFLQKANGTVYLVSYFSDGKVMDVFKLKRIGDCDFSKDKLYYPESGSELDGVSLDIVSSDFSGDDPFIKIRWKNDTSDQISFGEMFELYYNENGKWKDSSTKEHFWLLPAYMLLPGSKHDKIYKLSEYDISKPGVYRFEAKFNIHGQNDVHYKVWIDFEIKDDTLINFSLTEDTTVPSSNLTAYTMDCIINEISGNHFVVEKILDNEKSGILYQFDYNSEEFKVGDEIVVEYKYPIAESFPYGLTDVKVYKSE